MQPRSPATQPPRVAVLDADARFVQTLLERFDALGWDHRVLGSVPPAQELVAARLDALVIDLAALGPSAWDHLERVCTALPELAVVVCTGRSSAAQRVRGLRLGADDWLTKPCHPEELVARIEAVRRRRRRGDPAATGEAMAFGEIVIHPREFKVVAGGATLDLTRREFELLELLASAHERVLAREEIYRQVWGYTMARGDRSVDVFVRKLRQKLAAASPHWRYIHTHFGVGYRFAADPVEAAGGREADVKVP